MVCSFSLNITWKNLCRLKTKFKQYIKFHNLNTTKIPFTSPLMFNLLVIYKLLLSIVSIFFLQVDDN